MSEAVSVTTCKTCQGSGVYYRQTGPGANDITQEPCEDCDYWQRVPAVSLTELGEQAVTDLEQRLIGYSLTDLAATRDWHEEEIKRLRSDLNLVNAEIERRVHEDHPDWDGASGSRQIADADTVLTFGYDRDYEYSLEALEQLKPLITEKEWRKLVQFKPKVDGNAARALARLGGEVAELIGRARQIKRKSPTFKFERRL